MKEHGIMDGKKLRIARYLRVSRGDQNPSLQADETAQIIERRGWELVDTYLDRGVSGSRDKRPALDKMLAAAKRGEFDAVIVWRSDRLFRSLRHMVVTLDELAALGIGFVSATEVFDTLTPQGRLLLHLVSAFAEFERALLIERTKAGLDAARRRGSRIGRPRVRVDVAKALHLRAQGKSLREVARVLKCGVATVHRALKDAQPGVPEPSVQEAPDLTEIVDAA